MGYWWIIRFPILFAYLVRLSVCVCLSPMFIFIFIFSFCQFAIEQCDDGNSSPGVCWHVIELQNHTHSHSHARAHTHIAAVSVSPAVSWQMLL